MSAGCSTQIAVKCYSKWCFKNICACKCVCVKIYFPTSLVRKIHTPEKSFSKHDFVICISSGATPNFVRQQKTQWKNCENKNLDNVVDKLKCVHRVVSLILDELYRKKTTTGRRFKMEKEKKQLIRVRYKISI